MLGTCHSIKNASLYIFAPGPPPIPLALLRARFSYPCQHKHCHVFKCWGNNLYGQARVPGLLNVGINPSELGDNLTTVSLGTNSGVELEAFSVVSGTRHNCALILGGQVKASLGATVGMTSVPCSSLRNTSRNIRPGPGIQYDDNLPPRVFHQRGGNDDSFSDYERGMHGHNIYYILYISCAIFFRGKGKRACPKQPSGVCVHLAFRHCLRHRNTCARTAER